MTRTLTLAQARRIAIAAQGLDRSRPEPVTMRHITQTIKRIGLLQIDSVNVLTRAHLLPLFARLGPYDTNLIHRATGRAPRRIIETWAHEASYVPATTFPLLTWNKRRWPGMNPATLEADYPEVFDRVKDIVTHHGPLTSRDVEARMQADYTQRADDQWGWSWSPAKIALEILFDAGELTPAGRTTQFERVYDLTERVLPPKLRTQQPVPKDTAIVELTRIAARAHGIGTLRCFADYFSLSQQDTRSAVEQLETTGELQPVTVTGWERPVWLSAAARIPPSHTRQSIISPV